MTWVWIAGGAAVGAVLRFVAGLTLDRPGRTWAVGLPLGTLTVNVLGSLILGVLMGSSPDPDLTALLGVGFCGGLSTYSSFGYETWRLIETGSTPRAIGNVALNLVLGLAAVSVGWLIGA